MKTNAVSLGSRENSGVPSLIESWVAADRGPTFEIPVKADDEVAKSVKANARNEKPIAIFLMISLKSLVVGTIQNSVMQWTKLAIFLQICRHTWKWNNPHCRVALALWSRQLKTLINLMNLKEKIFTNQ